MYVGVLLVILGIAALYGARAVVLYAAAVGLGFHLMVVLYEEPALRRSFGADYDLYVSRVSRWVPGVGPRETPNTYEAPIRQ